MAVVLGSIAIGAVPASAREEPQTAFLGVVPLSVSATFTPDGDGLMTADGFQATTPPTWTPSWERCNAVGEACRPFGAGEHVAVGGAPAGSRFKALGEAGAVALG